MKCEACQLPARKQKCWISLGKWPPGCEAGDVAEAEQPAAADTWLPATKAKYEPEDFRKPQQVLPHLQKRKGTQLARTAELAAEREARDAHLREEGSQMSREQLDRLEELLAAAMLTIAEHETEVHRLRRERNSLLASKRQRALTAWFQRPDANR